MSDFQLGQFLRAVQAGKLLKEQLNKSSETYIQISFVLLIYFKDGINCVLSYCLWLIKLIKILKHELPLSIKGQWTKITWPFEIPHHFPWLVIFSVVICFSLLLLTWNYTKMYFRSPHRGAIMLQFEGKKKSIFPTDFPVGL